jgi:uncharacterized protein YijF (DUF1287 family)
MRLIVITYDSEYISMGGTVQCYQKMKKEFKSYPDSWERVSMNNPKLRNLITWER